MTFLQPFVNLLTLLTVLSYAAERITNLVKLRLHPCWGNFSNRQREYNIAFTNLFVGVALALVTKADLFALLARADAPWDTLGWARWDGKDWIHCDAVLHAAGLAQTVLGCGVIGVAIGVGSRFWHDVLGAVLDLRNVAKRKAIG